MKIAHPQVHQLLNLDGGLTGGFSSLDPVSAGQTYTELTRVYQFAQVGFRRNILPYYFVQTSDSFRETNEKSPELEYIERGSLGLAAKKKVNHLGKG